ncbi:hypothetical protein GCM10011529_30680 [Polymorphobacter glacialis]|uniref:AlpA family phage regulatory protein n=2 Tax=Sandarakinorhabdus glacialis TaxID=1614636 RepID=A0A917A379_9SPHN|nr:hypothetical protein GCM10011529_30680 [Polymorphobacter glacialis]
MNTAFDEGPRIYRAGQLYNVVGLKRNAIEQRMQQNDFPKPIILGPRSKGWLVHEVHSWLLERKAQRDATGQGHNPCPRPKARAG